MSEMKKKIADLMAQHSLKRASECAPKDAPADHDDASSAKDCASDTAGVASGMKPGAPPPDGDVSSINAVAAQAMGGVPSEESPDDELRRRRRTLLDLSHRLNLRSGAEWAQEREVLAARLEAGDFEIDRVIPGELVGDGESRFFLVRRDYPLDYQQGDLRLGDALQCLSAHVAFSACDPALADFNPQTALFMDTETIGLAGGAGTVAFLVGVGYFAESMFRLDQCFLRDYDDEEAMLHFLAERFTGCGSVVGYNSKSFDLPLLRTRFIQHRIPFPLEGAPHYDLVHAARRFYKRRLADCSLGNIERAVLGIHRRGDVPSYLIPQMWFDYLRTRDARPLDRLFYHHRMDVLSLVSLTGWLSRCLATPDGGGFEHVEDRISLVRLHFRQKQYEQVLAHANAFLEREERSPLRRECLGLLATACKRTGRWLEMQQALELLVQEFPGDVGARIELAKFHEHRSRDLLKAESLLVEALAAAIPEEGPAIQVRLNRVRGKIARIRRFSRGGRTSDDDTGELPYA